MKDSQLLSTYADAAHSTPIGEPNAAPRPSSPRRAHSPDRQAAPAQAVQVFDACHAGVVLRAVLGLALALAVASLFASPRLSDWWLNYALWVGCATPGLFVWLIVCCLSKALLARLPDRIQWAIGVLLGAAAGALAHAVAQWLGILGNAYWLGFGGVGALMASLLVAGLVWRSKAQMPAATHARLVELQARIRPHFLFNALNSAMALVRDDPQRAEQVLEDLSDLFRHALVESSTDVSLDDELALARSYLNIEQIRFGERMQVEWALDAAAAAARVPALLLQPLVENAVKHGVERTQMVTHIKVSTQRRGATVVVRVTNTVDAQATTPDQPGNGMALANVRERLALLHDVHASFRAMHTQGVFQARIELPIGVPAAPGSAPTKAIP